MNNCLGYRKSNPLTGSLNKNQNIEKMRLKNHLIPSNNYTWFKHFLIELPGALLLDRHFLNDQERTIRISNKINIEGILFHNDEKGNNINNNNSIRRRIPVALLRKFFYKKDLINYCLKKQTNESIERTNLLMKNDNFHKETTTTTTIDEYYDKANEYFKLILDLTLLSFETCLLYFLWRFNNNEWFPLVGLFNSISTQDYWKGFKLPDKLLSVLKEKDNISELYNSDYIILFVIIWRMNASIIIEKELFGYYYSNSSSSLLCNDTLYKSRCDELKNKYNGKYVNIEGEYYKSTDNRDMEYVRYNFLLFRDTHLGLLTSMVKTNIYKDKNIVYNGTFRRFYPGCINVCCVEELPDMTYLLPLMNLWYDKGTKRETSEEEIDALRHIFTIKPMNQICLVRNISLMINEYNKKYPIVLELFKLTMKCVILGNLPYAKNPLNLMARIHFNSMFDNDNNNNIFPSFNNNTESSSSSTSKRTVNEKVLGWINRCKYFTLFILREFLFYTCEVSVIDNILSRNSKWDSFKELSRYGTGDVRKELSYQCSLPGFKEINWDKIELRTKNTKQKNSIERKSGILKGYHTQTLEYSDKLFKAEFEKILPKKMRAIEPMLDLNRLYYLVNQDEFKYQTSFLPDNSLLFKQKRDASLVSYDKDKFYLNNNQFHFLCWCIAKRKKPILETKWLYLLNISEEGINIIKDWILSYYELSIADNSFKKYAINLYRENPLDYLILKSYIKTIESYKNNIFYLPLEDTLYQFDAIRKTLRLESWEPTPSRAGYGLLCMGCHRWANKITDSYEKILTKKKKKSDMDLDNELNNILLSLSSTSTSSTTSSSSHEDRKSSSSCEDEEIEVEVEKEKDDFEKLIEQSNIKYSKNKQQNKKKKKTKRKSKGKGKGRINRNGKATYLSTALYDPTKDQEEGSLYCKRGNYNRNYIVEDITETTSYSTLKLESHTEFKNNIDSIFKGFYESYNSNKDEDSSQSYDISDTKLPDFDESSNIILKHNNNNEDIEIEEDDDDDEGDVGGGGGDDDEDLNKEDIDPDILTGVNDIQFISDNRKKFESFENIKIPNLVLNKYNNTIYGYINIKTPNDLYNDNGYPIENIIITNKLEKTSDNNNNSFIFKSLQPNEEMIIDDSGINVPIKNINQLIGNTLSINESFNINKKNNDSRIPSHLTMTSIINQIISQKFNCYNQLENIDLVGIYFKYKNITYALCVYCGCFLRVCNKNFCNKGISCGRHATSSHRFDNIIWQLDKDVPPELKLEYSQKTKCLTTKKDERFYALNHTNYSSVNQLFKNRRFVHMFDYRAITPKMPCFPNSRCRYCGDLQSFGLIPVTNFAFKILEIPLCKGHHKQCKYKYTKKALQSLTEVENCIFQTNKL